MGQHVSRRSILKAAGVGGVGLAGVGATGQAVAAYRNGGLPGSDRKLLPRLPDGVRITDRPALGRDGVLARGSIPAPAARLVELISSPGDGLSHLDLDVRQFAFEFICDPRRPNVLIEGVSRLSYEITEIAWQAGSGWPIYRDRSPCSDHAIEMRYAGVPRHQIVLIDDRAVYVGNIGSFGVIDGIEGPVRIDVNGDRHDDHRGFYKVRIMGIA